MRNSSRNTIGLVTVLAVSLSTCQAFGWGGRGDRGGGHYDRGGHSDHGGYYYRGGHYYGPGWFGLGLFAAAVTVGAVVASLPPEREVVVVNGYPYPYYRYDNVYYQSCPTGYVVVEPPAPQTVVVQPPPPPVAETIVMPAPATPQPVVVPAPAPPQPVVVPEPGAPQPVAVSEPAEAQPAAVPAASATPATDTYTVNIPNSDGTTYTAVVLHNKGNGYVGPQGEFYPEFPRVAQLKAMYGK